MPKQRTLQECERWLFDFLRENGKTMVVVVRNVSKFYGFTRGQVTQARKNLDLHASNNYSRDTGMATEWYWELKDETK